MSDVVILQGGAVEAVLLAGTGPTGTQGPTGATGSGTATVADRTALAAVSSPVSGESRILIESGREGLFVFSTADLSASVTNDPNQSVYVAPASDTDGSSGAWVRVRSEDFFNVKWFGAKGDGVIDEVGNTATGTNDTAAIQAAINYLTFRGGGTLFFPKSVYIVSSAHTTTNSVNSQIVLPFVADINDMISIRFLGETPPPLSGGTNDGSIIMSTHNGIGGSTISSIIGCKGPGADRSWLQFDLDNMIVRNKQDSDNSGLDLRQVHVHGIRRSRIDVIGGFSGVSVTVTQPTYTLQFGVLGSTNNLPLWSIFSEVLVFGHYYGVWVSELTGGNNLCVSGCHTALIFAAAQHPSWFGRVLILCCIRAIAHENAAHEFTMFLDLEHTPLPAGWAARSYDIDDPNHVLRGIVRWHMHESPYTLSVNGANNLKIEHEWGVDSANSFSQIFSSFPTVVSRSGLVETYEPNSAKVPWHSFVCNKSGASVDIGQISFSNFAGAGSEKRRVALGAASEADADNASLYLGVAKAAAMTFPFRIKSDGSFGYTAGTGGSVTQITSKSTAVTLNKPCGSIVMHNASLAAGAVVSFNVNNSLISGADVIDLNIAGDATVGAYIAQVDAVDPGVFAISVRNMTAGALGEAIILTFAITKSFDS